MQTLTLKLVQEILDAEKSLGKENVDVVVTALEMWCYREFKYKSETDTINYFKNILLQQAPEFYKEQ